MPIKPLQHAGGLTRSMAWRHPRESDPILVDAFRVRHSSSRDGGQIATCLVGNPPERPTTGKVRVTGIHQLHDSFTALSRAAGLVIGKWECVKLSAFFYFNAF